MPCKEAEAKTISACEFGEAPIVHIQLEHAVTREQNLWGLMDRRHLPNNQGMTFNYPEKKLRGFWMFNCWIDLSIAFLDQNKVIREIQHLKAYPEKMDQRRPVHSLHDMRKYRANDSVVQFFQKRRVSPQHIAHYALEVNKGWFENKNVHVGDVVLWDVKSPQGQIIHALAIDQIAMTEDPVKIEFLEEAPQALWRPNSRDVCEVSFFSTEGGLVGRGLLKGGKDLRVEHKSVIYTSRPAKYALLREIK